MAPVMRHVTQAATLHSWPITVTGTTIETQASSARVKILVIKEAVASDLWEAFATRPVDLSKKVPGTSRLWMNRHGLAPHFMDAWTVTGVQKEDNGVELLVHARVKTVGLDAVLSSSHKEGILVMEFFPKNDKENQADPFEVLSFQELKAREEDADGKFRYRVIWLDDCSLTREGMRKAQQKLQLLDESQHRGLIRGSGVFGIRTPKTCWYVAMKELLGEDEANKRERLSRSLPFLVCGVPMGMTWEDVQRALDMLPWEAEYADDFTAGSFRTWKVRAWEEPGGMSNGELITYFHDTDLGSGLLDVKMEDGEEDEGPKVPVTIRYDRKKAKDKKPTFQLAKGKGKGKAAASTFKLPKGWESPEKVQVAAEVPVAETKKEEEGAKDETLPDSLDAGAVAASSEGSSGDDKKSANPFNGKQAERLDTEFRSIRGEINAMESRITNAFSSHMTELMRNVQKQVQDSMGAAAKVRAVEKPPGA